MKLTIKRIREPLFETNIVILLFGSYNEAAEWIKKDSGTVTKFNTDDPSALGEGFVYRIKGEEHKNKTPYIAIYWNGRGLDALAHECWHLTECVLRNRGIEDNEILGELGAYFEHIYLLAKLIKKGKK